MKTNIELAVEIAALLKNEKARAWKNRVYLRKGFLIVNDDGSVDTAPVVGVAFAQGIAGQLRVAGYNVPAQKIAGGIEI